MADVFICYSRHDLDFVRDLAEGLRERTADLFVDLGEWWQEDEAPERDTPAPEGQPAVGGPDDSLSAVSGLDGSISSVLGIARPPGERAEEVHAAITGATAVVVVLTDALLASSRCRHEIERAAALRKRIIVARKGGTPASSLAGDFRPFAVVEFDKADFDTGVRELVEQIEAGRRRLSTWTVLHGRRWTLIGIMALICVSLGLWGYSDLYPRLAFLDRLYAALALFRDTTTLYSTGTAAAVVAPPFPWPLEVARWFSPLTLVLAGLSAIFAVLAEPFTRVRIHALYRRHLVVCGLGHLGLRLAAAFRARGERVVVVDCSPSSVALSRCWEMSVPVLVADATDPEVLRQAGIERATRVIAVCGDNAVNDRIGMAAKRVVALEQRPEKRRHRLDCFLHVDDDQMCERLEQSSLAESNKNAVTLNYVNVFRSGGLALLGEFPHSFAERDGRVPLVVVIGPDRIGMLLVVGAVREWWFDHRHDGLRLDLTLVAADAKKRLRGLRRRYSHFDEACRLVALDCDPADPESTEVPVLVRDEDWARTTIFVCYADESQSLEAVMQLAGGVPSRVPIIVLTAGQTGPVTLLDRAATQLHMANVTTFPLLDRLCRPEVFVNSVREQMAKAMHNNYLRHRRMDGSYDPHRESHRPWDVLKETYRDSNRDAAAHLVERLDDVGYSVVVSDDWAVGSPSFSRNDLLRLAQSEHERWCEERRADGWTRGDQVDSENKRHPDLVPWSELGEPRRELDLEAQRELPALLARYGLAIVRKPKSRRSAGKAAVSLPEGSAGTRH